MFKIGEFSKLTQVSIRMLRYYDQTGLLQPAQTDPQTGYRSYAVEQIPRLQKIILLRDLGYSVPQITEVMNNWSEAPLNAHLEAKKAEIERNIAVENEKLVTIDQILRDSDSSNIDTQSNFTIRAIPQYEVASLRKVVPNYFCEGLLWKELGRYCEKEKIAVAADGHNFAIYHDLEYREENVDIEVCAVVEQMGENSNEVLFRKTEPVALMACNMIYGPFENIRDGFLSFAEWLADHPIYRMKGKSRQICHKGPWNEAEPENYLTEVQMPLKKL